MLYSEKMPIFTAKYPAQTITVDGAAYRYVRIGAGRDKTLVLLNGGMVAQIYTQKYPNEVGGLVLVSTGGMDAATLKTLKKKYFFVPLALWYMAHCNYEKLKPRLIQSGMSHLRNESAEEAAYARDMFETIFKDFQQAKDVHITGLLADLMNQTPVTEADFRALKAGDYVREIEKFLEGME